MNCQMYVDGQPCGAEAVVKKVIGCNKIALLEILQCRRHRDFIPEPGSGHYILEVVEL